MWWWSKGMGIWSFQDPLCLIWVHLQASPASKGWVQVLNVQVRASLWRMTGIGKWFSSHPWMGRIYLPWWMIINELVTNQEERGKHELWNQPPHSQQKDVCWSKNSEFESIYVHINIFHSICINPFLQALCLIQNLYVCTAYSFVGNTIGSAGCSSHFSATPFRSGPEVLYPPQCPPKKRNPWES